MQASIHRPYILYGWHQTGSLAIEAALNEAGATYELRPISTKQREQLTENYRTINPRQQLPSLQLPDGTVMTEGAAMLLHIADAFPQARLAPAPGSSDRAQHDRWMFFFAVNVYEGELRKVRPERYTSDAAGAEAVRSAANTYVNRHYSIFEQQLNQSPYVFGDHFTVLDIYVWMLAQWLDIPWLRENCPKVTQLAETVMMRPAIRPVHLSHFSNGLGFA
jgi:glutathione S-transferase